MSFVKASGLIFLDFTLLWPLSWPLWAEVPPSEDWPTASPESEGLDAAALEALWGDLRNRETKAFVVIRDEKIVFERYASGFGRTTQHYTASMAKALVGGLSLMMAMSDGRIKPDDLASKYLPGWRDDPQKRRITIRHLSTHTSGIEDAEADGLPHEGLTGWKGDFWKRLDPPRDPFTIARDLAPALDPPGTRARYSNPGMALLAYCVTASLRGAPDADLRALLKHRIMDPLGIRETEWSCGYGAATQLDGLALVASWGGGAYSPNATARVGLLMLQRGAWGGKQLIPRSVVEEATAHAGMPGNSGLGWWVNRRADGTLEWKSAPEDAFWGAGAGHQFLWVVPSLNLIAVRNGENLDKGISFDGGLEIYIVAPLMKALFSSRVPPYPQSPVIKRIEWGPRETIRREALGSDNWPLTWADDDQLYTAYGDGNGFDPNVPEKLSLGFARVTGSATEFAGVNIRSGTGEQKGDGEAGKKASGILMVDGILYLWARNAGNSQLAWSADHGVTWAWSEWTFKTSFGSPTFLNFGRNYAGSRDGFVYIYSHDSDSAYSPADRMVLARAPKERIKSRDAYEFFNGLDPAGAPVWTSDIQERGAVFVHAGRCCRSSVSYNSALRRYLWCQTLPGGDARFRGGFGIYDAPEPWGPWTTAFFAGEWDVPPGETSSFPTRWMSEDGKALYLVFSGDDSFSVRKAVLTTATPGGS